MPLLPAHSERLVPLGNKDVIEAFKKGNCYPFAGEKRSPPFFSLNLSEKEAGENYTAFMTGCGICYFDARVFARYDIDEKGNVTFNKTVRSYFDFPVNITARATITSSK